MLDDDQFRAIAAHLLYLPQPSIKSETVGLQLHNVSGAAQALRLDARGRCLFDAVLSNSGAEYTRQHDQLLSALEGDCCKAAGVTVSLEDVGLFGQYAQGDKPGLRVDILALMPTPGGLFRQVVYELKRMHAGTSGSHFYHHGSAENLAKPLHAVRARELKVPRDRMRDACQVDFENNNAVGPQDESGPCAKAMARTPLYGLVVGAFL